MTAATGHFATAADYPELNSFPQRGITIPLGPRVPMTDRVRAIVDMRVLQRLRFVRQLAFAHLIYPGATHTRFEHTLGVYLRTCAYLNVLLSDGPGKFKGLATVQDVSALMVAALLHDAGHYPMAHSFEELLPTRAGNEDAQRHDVLFARALGGKVPQLLTDAELQLLGDQLDENWHGIKPGDVAAVLTGHRSLCETINPVLLPVLQSILDGPLDADKLDYLQRDSLHTGNPVGLGIDERRLVDSLIVTNTELGIGIRERGLAAAQTLLQARFSMFLTVYWHRANRARVRMFTEAVGIHAREKPNELKRLLRDRAFSMDDEAMLASISDGMGDRERSALVEPLRLARADRVHAYVRVLTIRAAPDSPKEEFFSGMPDDPHSRICKVFEDHLSKPSDKWPDFDKAVRQKALQLAGAPGAPLYSVLLDVPDARYEPPVKDEEAGPRQLPNEFTIHTSDGTNEETISQRAPLFGDLLENWRKNARKVRIFASPLIADELKKKSGDLKKEILDLVKALPS